MRTRKIHGSIITIFLVPLFACGDAGTDSTPGELTSGEIAALAEEFPRLAAEEPLPPPRPSGDADPSAIPASLERRLSDRVLETVTGEASFYAEQFEGRRTASGIPFRQNQLVAAHRAYPFGTILRVTNTGNERSVNVRVVDRGPFGGSGHRMLDLSRRAAEQLGFISAGRANVRVEVLEWGRGIGSV